MLFVTTKRVHNRKEMMMGITIMEKMVTARMDLQLVEWSLKSTLARSSGETSIRLLLVERVSIARLLNILPDGGPPSRRPISSSLPSLVALTLLFLDLAPRAGVLAIHQSLGLSSVDTRSNADSRKERVSGYQGRREGRRPSKPGAGLLLGGAPQTQHRHASSSLVRRNHMAS